MIIIDNAFSPIAFVETLCPQCPVLIQIQSQASSYTSVFHPIATCKQLMSTLVSRLGQWSSLPRPSQDALEYTSWETGQTRDGMSEDEEAVSMVMRLSPCFCEEEKAQIAEWYRIYCFNQFNNPRSIKPCKSHTLTYRKFICLLY